MADAKYFTSSKKGEIAELKEELNSRDKAKKKDAVKKVIAAMTVSKDVSSLFPDVVNCMQTNDVELKKLVYLYVMNYAKSQPDLAILAVNTFVMDAQDPNPLIRALAVRTMGCIRVDKITEYLCEPLARCLKDADPYVRKTAAVCVAKLYDINAELVSDKGFVETLKDLLSDANPMVVANTVAALSEIAETSGRNDVLPISHSNLQKLQAALNECTEWGQVFILDALAQYQPSNSREAEALVERVLPRLNHANSAVVLSAVKICMKFLDVIENEDFTRALLRKLGPSLVTLLSREPEVQYVALRNINLVVQKRPAILAHEIKVFYCKYNDPVYVKLEKLEIMIRLAGERNIDQVLLEFKEYATEVDVDFVRKSVRAIGRCAVKIEKAAERCINVLLELIQTKVNYVVQEAIVVIKDIFRRYPDKYESIIATLCESLERLDEPEAKGSMIWIIGEYAGRIDNADALLESFLDSFADEPCEVQLQLLTATVKLFLKKPTETQEMVQKVLTMTTQMVDNPDLRDRGFLYWRLLSTDPEAAKRVVLADKPVISDDTNSLDAAHLDTLIGLMSTLSSVYHKVPEAFVNKGKVAVREEEEDDEGHHEDDDGPTPAELRDREMGSHAGGGTVAPVVDLLDLNLGGPEPAAAAGGAVSGLVSGGGGGGGGGGAAGAGTSDLDLGSLFGAPAAPASQPAHSQQRSKPVLVTAEKGKGLVVEGAFNRRQGSIYFDLTLRNTTAAALGNFAIQFNKNSFGVAVPTDRLPISSLAGSSSADVAVPCVISQDKVKPGPLAGSIQIALNSNLGIIYFESPLHLHAVFTEDGRLDKSHFLQLWKDFGDANERSFVVRDLDSDAPEHVQAVLEQRNVFFIARRDVGAQIVMYYAAKASTGMAVLMELTLAPGSRACKAAVKLPNLEAVPLVEAALKDLLVSGQAPAAQPFAQPSSSNNNNVLIGSLI